MVDRVNVCDPVATLYYIRAKPTKYFKLYIIYIMAEKTDQDKLVTRANCMSIAV